MQLKNRVTAWLLSVCLIPAITIAADAPPPTNTITETIPVAPAEAPSRFRPNFDGAWQKDFARSDQWDAELQRILDQMQRNARYTQSAGAYGVQRRRGSASIIELAQLAEYISRQTTIRIRQTTVEVRVQREGDADLVCSTLVDFSESFISEYGNEVCGWEGQQLVYRIFLPDGIDILHRFSLSADREDLNMVTSISAGGEPFNLRQFYWRYEAPSENYNCIQTLSRGNTCSLTDFQRGF